MCTLCSPPGYGPGGGQEKKSSKNREAMYPVFVNLGGATFFNTNGGGGQRFFCTGYQGKRTVW